MGDKKRKLVESATEEPVTPDLKKAKKEKKEKKEKRKAEKEAEQAAPIEAAEKKASPVQEEVKEKKPKKEKLDQKQRREKKERKKLEKQEKMEIKEKLKHGNPEADEAERLAKEERKTLKDNNKKKIKKASESSESNEPAPAGNEEQAEAANEVAEEAAEGKNARFICFVGNLPYSANQESIQKHFAKNPPASIRVATKKEDNRKCRGFAFIEFHNYDRMKSCLKLYHHSTFDDGKYPPRAINVELTAGGGGNTDYRKGKIEAKNKKLYEERQRNAKQIQKDKKKHDKGQNKSGAPTGANAVGFDGANDAATGEDDKYAGVHPSRRPRMW